MEYTRVETAAGTVNTNAAEKAEGMDYLSIDDVTQRASVGVSCFTGASGVREYSVIVRPDEYADIETQLGWMQETYQTAVEALAIGTGTAVLRRFLLSDIVNQQDALAVVCQVGTQVNGGGGFTNPTFLVGKGINAAHLEHLHQAFLHFGRGWNAIQSGTGD